MGRGQSPGTFSMSGLAGALPDYRSVTPVQMSHHDQQRFLAGTQPGAPTYNAQQFTGQSPMDTANYPTHPSQIPSTYQPAYGQVHQSPQSHSAGPSPMHPSYPSGAFFPSQQQQYMYYPGQYGPSVQPQHGPYPSSYGQGPAHAYSHQGVDMSTMGGRLHHSGYSPSAPSPYTYSSSQPYLRPGSMPGKPYFAHEVRVHTANDWNSRPQRRLEFKYRWYTINAARAASKA